VFNTSEAPDPQGKLLDLTGRKNGCRKRVGATAVEANNDESEKGKLRRERGHGRESHARPVTSNFSAVFAPRYYSYIA